MNDYFLNPSLINVPEIVAWESGYTPDWYTYYPYIYYLADGRKLFLPRPYDCSPLHYQFAYFPG